MKKLAALAMLATLTTSTVVKANDYQDLYLSTQATYSLVLLDMLSHAHGHYHYAQGPKRQWLSQVKTDTVDFLDTNKKTAFLDNTFSEIRKADQFSAMDDVELAVEILNVVENY